MFDKPIFQGLLHSGLPDLEALYRVGKIPMVTRNTVVGAPGWEDKLGLPDESWVAAMVAMTNPQRGVVLIDHEDWLYGTQAERQATAAKYVTLYQMIKAQRPGWKIGWYCDPLRRDFWASAKDCGSSEYKTWQAMNTDLGAVMAPYTDIFMPSLYFFYTRDTASSTVDQAGVYIEAHLREVKRLRRLYGKLESPIYPYIWYRKHDDSRDLDADVWAKIFRDVLEQADGCVLWGGFKTTVPTGAIPWDENAAWWQPVKGFLTDKRRTT